MAVALQSGLLSLYSAKTARTFSSVFAGASSKVNEMSLRERSIYETSTSETSQKTSAFSLGGASGVWSGTGVGVGELSLGGDGASVKSSAFTSSRSTGGV